MWVSEGKEREKGTEEIWTNNDSQISQINIRYQGVVTGSSENAKWGQYQKWH
jgi:hypothetical protein